MPSMSCRDISATTASYGNEARDERASRPDVAVPARMSPSRSSASRARISCGSSPLTHNTEIMRLILPLPVPRMW